MMINPDCSNKIIAATILYCLGCSCQQGCRFLSFSSAQLFNFIEKKQDSCTFLLTTYWEQSHFPHTFLEEVLTCLRGPQRPHIEQRPGLLDCLLQVIRQLSIKFTRTFTRVFLGHRVLLTTWHYVGLSCSIRPRSGALLPLVSTATCSLRVPSTWSVRWETFPIVAEATIILRLSPTYLFKTGLIPRPRQPQLLPAAWFL